MAAKARLYQRAKNILHAVQALLILAGAMITIVIFTKGGQQDRRITYYFALCLICIPFLIYQTAFPVFQRSKRFANAYAHAIIDLVLSILWFAAFIGEIVWAKDGSTAAKDWKKGDKVCEKFAWGPTDKCHLGQTTMVIGAVICFLFGLTTTFSIYGVSFYRSHGTLPGNYDPKDPETVQSDVLEHTGVSPHTYDKLHGRQEMQQQQQDSSQESDVSSVHSHNEVNATIPSRPMSWQVPLAAGTEEHDFEPVDTSYHSPQIHVDNTSFQATPPRLHSPPRQYNPRPGPYQDYGNTSGDYTLPGQEQKSRFVNSTNHHSPPPPSSSMPETPTVRLDTRYAQPQSPYAGGRLPFPAGEYDYTR